MFQNFFFVVCLFVLFFAFVKTSLYGKFKNFKTNKAILTIVIKRKSIMMKTLLGNISVQKKKKSFRSLFGTDVWLWFVLFGAKG